MANLSELFDEDHDQVTYKFGLSSVAASCERAELIAGLATLMASNKSDPQVTADLLAAAGWAPAIAALRKGRISVRRGDFGEVLAAEAAEDFDGLVVPVRKLRYQIDPNQTLPGSDVVAFVFSDDGSDELDDLEFIESKYRTNPPTDIAVDAHERRGRR
jgi:hypothetical protein